MNFTYNADMIESNIININNIRVKLLRNNIWDSSIIESCLTSFLPEVNYNSKTSSHEICLLLTWDNNSIDNSYKENSIISAIQNGLLMNINNKINEVKSCLTDYEYEYLLNNTNIIVNFFNILYPKEGYYIVII